jgi:hypothetical protein
MKYLFTFVLALLCTIVVIGQNSDQFRSIYSLSYYILPRDTIKPIKPAFPALYSLLLTGFTDICKEYSIERREMNGYITKYFHMISKNRKVVIQPSQADSIFRYMDTIVVAGRIFKCIKQRK